MSPRTVKSRRRHAAHDLVCTQLAGIFASVCANLLFLLLGYNYYIHLAAGMACQFVTIIWLDRELDRASG